MIKFKKGAFVSLKAVKPFSAKSWAPFGLSPNDGGGMNLVSIMCRLASVPGWTYTLYEMPVFEPNDYFWKNHWDGKEEKW